MIHSCQRPLWLTGIPCILLGLLLLAGCVEAPQSDEFAAIDAVEIESDAADSPESVPAEEVTQAEPTDLNEDDGWQASPAKKDDTAKTKPLVTDTKSTSAFPAEPTVPQGPIATPPAVPIAAVASKTASLIPGGIGESLAAADKAPAPFPAEPAQKPEAQPVAEPKPEPKPDATSESLNTIPVATVPAPAALPVPEVAKPAEPTAPAPLPLPAEPVRPRSLIVISPKKLTPAPAPNAAPGKSGSLVIPPAIVLPPSAGADPAPLAKADGVKLAVPNPAPPVPAQDIPSATTDSPAPEVPAALPPALSTTPVPTEAAPVAAAPAAPPEGFTALFNGQDLSGWSVYDGKTEAWKFVNGAASCVSPGGGWLQSDQHFSDFELRFEYRLSAGGNSGVSLRFPGTGNPALEGLEIQLLDDRAEKYQNIQPQQATGSLYFAVAPQERDAAKAAGEWNQCTMVCEGSHLKVTINDKLVNDINLDQLTKTSDGVPRKVSELRSPVGSIALQSHVSQVDFRNVYVKDLTQTLASGVRWLDLVPGSGDEVPAGAKVTVHYIGHLKIGKKFASSVDKGKPTTVPLKDVIPGWREGIPGMKVGGKRRLIVPPELAYGAKGFKEVIPPNSTLVYEIELLGFEKLLDPLVPQSAQGSDGSQTK